MATDISSQILKTKLQSPQLPSDLIERKELIEYVNQNIKRPLTLVSAGGGFGKSTFVSSWLKGVPYKNGWLSIDENDNDLRTFLTYFVAAIQKEVPDFGQRIIPIILTSTLPPVNVIAGSLINDLAELTELFILALDDLYLINNKEIFQILAQLLKFPPEFFHLVLITRIDPPLPLTQLRSKNMIKDIRASHLKITTDEIKSFISHWIEGTNIDKIALLLDKKLDGWITGLRLAMLHISLHQKEGKEFEQFLEEFNFSADYFLEEVFEHMDDNSKEFLLKTSVLEKFSPELTDFIMERADSRNTINGFIEKNLFIINLDTENKWYRYHHLLQSLLRRELKKKFSGEEITAMHLKAVEWYRLHAMFEDAFYHALQTGNNNIVADFIKKDMHQPLNMDKWYILDEWLKKLPDKVIHESIPLLLAQMWVLHHKNKIWLLPDSLQQIEKLKKEEKISKEIETEIQFFKGILFFWNVQIKESYKLFKYVKENLSKEKIGAKGINAIYYAIAAQMNGDVKEVVAEYEKLLSHNGMLVTYKHLLLGGIIYVKLLEGDLFVAEDYITTTEKSALRSNDIFVISWMNYFSGVINYQQGNFEKAEKHFQKALDKIYTLNMNAPIDCFAGMLLTLQVLGKNEKFDEMYNQMIEFVNEQNKPFMKAFSYSLRTRLALINKNLQSAERYMDMTDMFFDSGNVLYGIEVPRLTNIKLLLAQNSSAKIEEAINKLNDVLSLFQNTRNNFQLIPTLILQAVAYKKKGEKKYAINFLTDALIKGKPSNWIAPFVEAGEEVRDLLSEVKADKSLKSYIKRILEKFPKKNKSKTAYAESERLTNRELDVITLLAKRYSNKEIANELFISPSTVKRHTITIYQKLGVNKRQQAVAKAEELGLL